MQVINQSVEYTEFRLYLLRDLKLATATVNKTIDNIKRLEQKNALSKEGFDTFQLHFLTTGLSNAYLNKYIQAIKHWSTFNHFDWGNQIQFASEDEVIRDAFTDEEIELFLSLSAPEKQSKENYLRWQLFWKICAFTGCRPIEVRSLRMEDVNLHARSLRYKHTKTKKDREVYISDRFYPELCDYVVSHPGKGYLFYYRDTKTISSDSSYKTDFKQRCQRLGIKNRFPYSFRHSFVTRQILDAQNPLSVVMDIVGHKDPKTTLRYTHNDFKAQKKAIERDPLNDKLLSSEKQFQKLIEAIQPFLDKEIFEYTRTNSSIEIHIKKPTYSSIE